jgi:hypothetical protein
MLFHRLKEYIYEHIKVTSHYSSSFNLSFKIYCVVVALYYYIQFNDPY